MRSHKKKKVRVNSTLWFSTLLEHPVFTPHITEIRKVCAITDSLHRTVSGPAADALKSAFLIDLQTIVSSAEDDDPKHTNEAIRRLLTRVNQSLRKLSNKPAQNPKDWQVKDSLAQVRLHYHASGKQRPMQGGAPQ